MGCVVGWVVFLLCTLTLGTQSQPVPNVTEIVASRAAICRAQESSPTDHLQNECYYANSSWLIDTKMTAAKAAVAEVMLIREDSLRAAKHSAVVYIHAYMPPNNAVGMMVLDKLLSTVIQSTLLDDIQALYINAMGNTEYVRQHVGDLMESEHLCFDIYGRGCYDGKGNLIHTKKVQVITALKNLGKSYEFPTLALLQHHAKFMPPDGKILYMHTKGVTQYKDQVSDVISHEICPDVLELKCFCSLNNI